MRVNISFFIVNVCMHLTNLNLFSDKEFFWIRNKASGKVLNACLKCVNSNSIMQDSVVYMEKKSFTKDSQLWFWENDYLRNKQHPTKVLDLDTNDYQGEDDTQKWGKVVLHDQKSIDSQKWQITGDKLVCKWGNLILDIWNNDQKHGANVGCHEDTNSAGQLWIFEKGQCIS